MAKSTCWASLNDLVDQFVEAWGSLPEELTLDVGCYDDLITEMPPLLVAKPGHGYVLADGVGDRFAGMTLTWYLPPRERRHILTMTVSRGDRIMTCQEAIYYRYHKNASD